MAVNDAFISFEEIFVLSPVHNFSVNSERKFDPHHLIEFLMRKTIFVVKLKTSFKNKYGHIKINIQRDISKLIFVFFHNF